MLPPPCLSIWIISYFIHNHTPFRLMLRTRSQVSSVHSWRGARGREPIPALLWAQSNLPYVSTAVLIMASTAVASDTSAWTKMASPPCSVIMWTVWCPPSSFMSATTSFAPSRANVRAVARPIPEAPPVTNATFPSTCPAMVTPPVYTYCHRPRKEAILCLGVRDAMFLTPRHRYLSQGCITILIPLFSHPIQLHPVFETLECSSPTDGVTEIIAHVLIVYREAEPLHDAVFMDLEAVRQREIVIHLSNLS